LNASIVIYSNANWRDMKSWQKSII